MHNRIVRRYRPIVAGRACVAVTWPLSRLGRPVRVSGLTTSRAIYLPKRKSPTAITPVAVGVVGWGESRVKILSQRPIVVRPAPCWVFGKVGIANHRSDSTIGNGGDWALKVNC